MNTCIFLPMLLPSVECYEKVFEQHKRGKSNAYFGTRTLFSKYPCTAHDTRLRRVQPLRFSPCGRFKASIGILILLVVRSLQFFSPASRTLTAPGAIFCSVSTGRGTQEVHTNRMRMPPYPTRILLKPCVLPCNNSSSTACICFQDDANSHPPWDWPQDWHRLSFFSFYFLY